MLSLYKNETSVDTQFHFFTKKKQLLMKFLSCNKSTNQDVYNIMISITMFGFFNHIVHNSVVDKVVIK